MLLFCLFFNPFRAYSQCTNLGIGGYVTSVDNNAPLPFCDIITFTAVLTNNYGEDITGLVATIAAPNNAQVLQNGFDDDYEFYDNIAQEYFTEPIDLAAGSSITLTFQVQHIFLSALLAFVPYMALGMTQLPTKQCLKIVTSVFPAQKIFSSVKTY